MGFDASYDITMKQKIYIAFFMDELTPEWIFNKKNHNWFAWQVGYKAKNILFNDNISFEYNWTDQRIFKHKYKVNDYYSHGQPLGFWAGPHAKEYLFDYYLTKGEHIFSIFYSLVKRGASTEQMVEENYNDIQSERYENGYEKSSIIKIKIVRASKIKGLQYALGVNQVEFINAGFNPSEPSYGGVSSNKLSAEFGMSYNFIYPK